MTAVIVDGKRWIVYTGDGPYELENLACSKARRIAKRMIASSRGTTGWKCSARKFRCVRGGTYRDSYGRTQWRYFIGWHGAD
jgi:hypothetical protein